MVDLVKVLKKWGHQTSAETPPPLVDLIHQNAVVFYLPLLSKGSLKKNIWMDLVCNGGGGVCGPSPLFTFFLLLMKKLCIKIGKE